MGWLSLVGDLLGIGKGALERRQKRKIVETESKLKIEEAIANAKVQNILDNNMTDNKMDLISKEQQANSIMDEIITFIFLMPLIVATITPFIIAIKTGNWLNLNADLFKSYENLENLPQWFIGGIILVIVNVLGFRSFLRKAFTLWIEKISAKFNFGGIKNN